MDFRDLMFWFRQAQVKMIHDQMKRIEAARLAGVDDSSYQRVMNDLECKSQELEFGKEKVVQDNWEFLRLRGKG